MTYNIENMYSNPNTTTTTTPNEIAPEVEKQLALHALQAEAYEALSQLSEKKICTVLAFSSFAAWALSENYNLSPEELLEESQKGNLQLRAPIEYNLIKPDKTGHFQATWKGLPNTSRHKIKEARDWMRDRGLFALEDGNFFQTRHVPYLFAIDLRRLLVYAEQAEEILAKEFNYLVTPSWREDEQDMKVLPPQVNRLRELFLIQFGVEWRRVGDDPFTLMSVSNDETRVPAPFLATLQSKFDYVREQARLMKDKAFNYFLHTCRSFKEIGWGGEEEMETEFAVL